MKEADKQFTVLKCTSCGATLILLTSEMRARNKNYITCPFYGKHKDMIVRGAYDDLFRCLKEKSEIDVTRIIK